MKENDEAGWEALSNWYDEKQGETGDLWHRALIDPALLRLIGDPNGKDLLDLGCGNGYLSRRLARQGGRVTAVDSSPRMIENAKKRDPNREIRYVLSDTGKLDAISSDSFDIVFANMSLMDIADCEKAISEISRVLRKGGKFVASIFHPCFDNGSNSSWVIEKKLYESKIYRKIRAYREPFSERVPWKLPQSDEKMFTIAFHRPLSWYARTIANSGLAITALEEPEPQEEFLDKESDAAGFLEVPLHLVIGAVKL